MVKKIVVLFIILLFIISVINVQASVENLDKANDLKTLGLFKGTNDGFELSRKPSRIEGAVMLVRLLGKESEAQNGIYNHPFTDIPNWADPYIGYMYENGLTNGISDTVFGANRYINVNGYITFILRALGYSDKKGDFNWNKSTQKALLVNLINENEYNKYSKTSFSFIRDDLVNISYKSLLVSIKNSDKKLLDSLIENNSVDSNNVMETNELYKYLTNDKSNYINEFDKAFYDYNQYPITNVQSLEDEIHNLSYNLYNLKENFSFTNVNSTQNSPKENIEQAMEIIEKHTGINRLISKGEYNNSYNVNYNISYIYTEEQLKAIKERSLEIINSIISEDMSEYEKVLTIHNYIINNCEYNTEYTQDSKDSSYNIYGCLIENKSVCQGYAETMNLLAHLANIECIVVEGSAYSDQSKEWIPHAWNIVKLDGEYYHIDTTWDDPVTKDNSSILSYNYFNITDNEMDNDHYWNKSDYPEASGKKYNYFVYNNMSVKSYREFLDNLSNSLESKEKQITIKVEAFVKSNYNNLDEIMFNKGVSSFSYSIDDNHGIISIKEITY